MKDDLDNYVEERWGGWEELYGQADARHIILKQAFKWLEMNENRIKNRPDLYPNGFDFPDYFDMPNSLVSKLSPEEVDLLQDFTYGWTN